LALQVADFVGGRGPTGGVGSGPAGHALTWAAQTGLSCSVLLRARVLRPLPRRDPPHVCPRTGVRGTWPSPRHDRLGSRMVNLSRLQASLHVAARVLASSKEALDAPLGPRGFRHAPWSLLLGAPGFTEAGLAPAGGEQREANGRASCRLSVFASSRRTMRRHCRICGAVAGVGWKH